MCSQTEYLIRKAIELNLDTVLVLNKIDRLVIELKLNPAEAYAHLRRLCEQVWEIVIALLSLSLISNFWAG